MLRKCFSRNQTVAGDLFKQLFEGLLTNCISYSLRRTKKKRRNFGEREKVIDLCKNWPLASISGLPIADLLFLWPNTAAREGRRELSREKRKKKSFKTDFDLQVGRARRLCLVVISMLDQRHPIGRKASCAREVSHLERTLFFVFLCLTLLPNETSVTCARWWCWRTEGRSRSAREITFRPCEWF